MEFSMNKKINKIIVKNNEDKSRKLILEFLKQKKLFSLVISLKNQTI